MASPTISQRLRHIIGDQFGAAIVEQVLEKAIKDAKEKASAPESTFYDPMSMFFGRDWTERMSRGLSYQDLRTMAKNPIIGSIIQTRLNQVAAFMSPQQDVYGHGYRIVSKQTGTKSDVPRAKAVADWIYRAGIPGYGEKTLEDYARKFMRDSLILDQACGEIVNKNNDTPAYLVAVDAATIRRTRASLNYATPPAADEAMYVQILQDRIIAEYPHNSMMFGVRNPHTDMNYCGYGASELELLIRTVATILNTERYNSGQLTQGGTSKGILVVRGDADTAQFDSFKRDFREAIRNAASYWRPPVLKVGKDAQIDWVALDRSNRDMEYAQLFDFLVKQSCGVYGIDPAEINWTIGQSGASVNFQSSDGAKIEYSKSKGLQPLLNFFANNMNLSVIDRIDDNFRMEFVGFQLDRKADSDIRDKEVRSYKTVNEQRIELGLKPLKGCDIILNTLFFQDSNADGQFDFVEVDSAGKDEDFGPDADNEG